MAIELAIDEQHNDALVVALHRLSLMFSRLDKHKLPEWEELSEHTRQNVRDNVARMMAQPVPPADMSSDDKEMWTHAVSLIQILTTFYKDATSQGGLPDPISYTFPS